jgi:hypothetical protein
MHRRNPIKTLGLLTLAVVAMVAVNASMAQANWQLKRNGTTVKTLNLTANLLGGELLIPGLGLGVNCTGGVATATLLNETTKLSGSTHASFTGCTVLSFPKCIVHSPGTPNGTILASGSGTATMSGEETYFLSESEEFTEINFLATACFLSGLSLRGSVLLTLLESGQAAATHLAHLDEEELFFGEEEVLIDGALGADTALSHVSEESGQTWSIGLAGL